MKAELGKCYKVDQPNHRHVRSCQSVQHDV